MLVEDVANGVDEVACEAARRGISKRSECGMNGKSWENAIVWDLQPVFGGAGT